MVVRCAGRAAPSTGGRVRAKGANGGFERGGVWRCEPGCGFGGGFGEQGAVGLAWDFAGAELREVRGHELGVEKGEAAQLESGDQVHEGRLSRRRGARLNMCFRRRRRRPSTTP